MRAPLTRFDVLVLPMLFVVDVVRLVVAMPGAPLVDVVRVVVVVPVAPLVDVVLSVVVVPVLLPAVAPQLLAFVWVFHLDSLQLRARVLVFDLSLLIA